jgi:uncharacterized protein YbjT (DUF2867 family)
MDFNNAAHGYGREKHHFAAVDAALKAGVGHIYYTSLAFGSESEAGVMQAHLRTEAYLKGLTGVKYCTQLSGRGYIMSLSLYIWDIIMD